MRRQRVKYDCDIQLGRSIIGPTPDVIEDYVSLDYISQNGEQYFNRKN